MAQSKERFLEAFLELCEEKELTKISVTDLVEKCETTRQTFYYHFKNIDELIDWAFKSKIENICNSIKPSDTWQDKSPEIFEVIKQYQVMIKNSAKTKKGLEMQIRISDFIGEFVVRFIKAKYPNFKCKNNFLIETLQYTVTGQIMHEIRKDKPDFDALCTYICNNITSTTSKNKT